MTTTNNQHTKQNSKQYIISKNVSPDDMREIAENFEDPSKYLSIDPRIVVGILPFQSKHSVPNILPSRPVTSTQTVTQLRPKTTSNLPINKAKKLFTIIKICYHIIEMRRYKYEWTLKMGNNPS